MNDRLISIVIPCYNEIANLRAGVLDRVTRFCSSKRLRYEMIVVDDGSSDGSREFLEAFVQGHENVRLIENEHFGKAGTVTTGVLAATGDLILFTDMDQATPIEELEKFLPVFDQGYSVVIGSRTQSRQGAPLVRKLMAAGMTGVRIAIVGMKDIHDTQCGFKMFQRDCAQDIFGQYKTRHKNFRTISGSSVNAGFDVELLYLAFRSGYRIKEVLVQWNYVQTKRVRPLRDSLVAIRELSKVRINIIRGVYNGKAIGPPEAEQ